MADDKPALIVQMSADLSKFEGAMKQAGDIADKAVSGIEGQFRAAFGGSFFGNLFANFATKGLESAIKLVSDLVDRFVDLDKVSKIVQVSMNDLFGIQEAATKFHVPIDEANASIKQLAVLLNQMQRGEKNSLTDLFDANPQALKGINRDALTLQTTLQVVEKIIQNAFNPLDKIDLGKFAGQTEAMSLALGRAGGSFTTVAQKASETAPDLDKIVAKTKEFDELISKATTSFKEFFATDTVAFFGNTKRELDAIISLSIKFISLFKDTPFFGGLAPGALEELEAARKSLSAERTPSEPAPRRILINGDTSRGDFSHVPKKPTPAEPRDSFERTEEQITRHTASVNADTIAVSQNSAVQAQLRAEFQLLNAIRKDDGEVTQAQIDAYTKLRATMSAQEALVAAGIELNARHKATFLADAEGAGVAQAAYTKAADGVAKLNSASSQLGSALSSAFADAVVEGKNLNDVFTSLIKTLEKAAINSVFASFFNQQAGGGLSPFASLLGLGKIGHNAGGTNYWGGGPTWVGENGPEIVNLPRGAQVVPNAVARKADGGGTSVYYNIDAAGADSGTVARIQAVLEQHAKAISGQGSTFISARRLQATGVG